MIQAPALLLYKVPTSKMASKSSTPGSVLESVSAPDILNDQRHGAHVVEGSDPLEVLCTATNIYHYVAGPIGASPREFSAWHRDPGISDRYIQYPRGRRLVPRVACR